jgi:hypothetical protein
MFASNRMLKGLIDEYNKKAKTFNLTILALSSVIKKMAISDLPQTDIDRSLILRIKRNIRFRYESLLSDLTKISDEILAEDSGSKLEVALFRFANDTERSDEVSEYSLMEYEIGLAIVQQIDKLSERGDVVDTVEGLRKEIQLRRRSVADLSCFLVRELEEKLHLDIFNL